MGRKKRRTPGCCTRCLNPKAEGHARCEQCMEKARLESRAVRERLREEGMCLRFCGRERCAESKSLCVVCLESERLRHRVNVGCGEWQPGRPGRPPNRVRLSGGDGKEGE